MTYCVAMRLNAGLVFLADSRTNAGVDQISTFRKMTVFEHPGERLMVLLSAGNLAITQAVRQIVCERTGPHDDSVWNAKTMFEAVRVVGDAVQRLGPDLGQDGSAGNETLGSSRLSPGLVKEELVHAGGSNNDGACSSPGSISVVGLGALASKTHIYLHRWKHNAVLKLHATNGYGFKKFHW